MFLNRASAFILPSKYEGHPKSLIEAMSCGLPCIGSNVVGIKEDIRHKETGYLCNTDYQSIAEAIDIVLSDESLQRYMGTQSFTPSRKLMPETSTVSALVPVMMKANAVRKPFFLITFASTISKSKWPVFLIPMGPACI